MPYIEKRKTKQNAVTWWGGRQATIVLLLNSIFARICLRFGGDRITSFLCGFSRGAALVPATSVWLTDEIASLWERHPDPRTIRWPANLELSEKRFRAFARGGLKTSCRTPAAAPCWVCGPHRTHVRDPILNAHLDLARSLSWT